MPYVLCSSTMNLQDFLWLSIVLTVCSQKKIDLSHFHELEKTITLLFNSLKVSLHSAKWIQQTTPPHTFGTAFCTWGSTAGPCPANLCKELTWGTLMGTAVIVPKVCWKKNSWTQLKTLAELPQIESARPSGSLPALHLSLPNSWWKVLIHQSIEALLLKSQRPFLLSNLLYKALLTKAYCLLNAFGNSECKGYISSLWRFFGETYHSETSTCALVRWCISW